MGVRTKSNRFTRLPTPTEMGIDSKSVRWMFAGDVPVEGAGRVLVFSENRLMVWDPSERRLVLDTPLEQVTDIRTTPGLGLGLLEAEVGGDWLILVRYSARLRQEAATTIRALDQIRSGHPPVSEQYAARICPRCQFPISDSGTCPRCVQRVKALTRMAGLITPFRRSVIILLLLLITGIGLDMVWPLLSRYLVDVILAPGNRAAQEGRAGQQLITMVVALASVHIARAIITGFSTRISGRIGNTITHRIRCRLVSHLQQLGLDFYSRQQTGALVGRVIYDTDAVQSLLTQVTSGFLMQILLVIVSFVMMLSLDPTLAFWTLIPAPPVIAGAFWYYHYVYPRYQRFWDRSGRQSGILTGIIAGIRTIKVFGRESYEQQRFEKSSDTLRDARQLLDNSSAIFYPVMGLVFQMGGWLVWYSGGFQVLRNDVSLGTLMAFFGYLSMFYGPLGSLTNLTTWLTQFSTQVHRIFEILDTEPIFSEEAPSITMTCPKGKIEFDDVNFGYTPASLVLQKLNFAIEAGSMIGLAGRSGSGKSTILMLIARLYDPSHGRVSIDDIDIRSIATDELRQSIAMVPQESFLFRGTIAENIGYGALEASRKLIIESAHAANAHDFILEIPEAYDYTVSEGGFGLSGGQKQRISIARAVIRSPRILLLDEATSNLDADSEMAIQRSLAEIVRGRTSVFVAHRVSTLASCDWIYILEHGKLVDGGTHQDLINRNAEYARWNRIQQGELASEHTVDSLDLEVIRSTVQWLYPQNATITRTDHQGLDLTIGDARYSGIFAVPCFPLHWPTEYLSLRRHLSGHRSMEVGLIDYPQRWPESARTLLFESLRDRRLMVDINRVMGIRKLGTYLVLSIQTAWGRDEVITRAEAQSTREVTPTERLIIDVDERIYRIQDINRLPSSDRRLLERHLYW